MTGTPLSDVRATLGRYVEHDPRSFEFPARRIVFPRSVLWVHRAPVLDQGDIGSCTGNALAQCLNTTYFKGSRPSRRYLDQQDAIDLYSVATGLDNVYGTYPPMDSGSTGLAVAKAGQKFGYLIAYHHAFGFSHFLGSIALQPVIVGTNWHEAMFEPDTHGYVKPQGDIVGGHEYLALGVNHRAKKITFLNSWSSHWGRRGRFYMNFTDFEALLAADGDVTVPIGR